MTAGKNGKIILPHSVSAEDISGALREYGARGVTLNTGISPYKSRINFRHKNDDEDRMVIIYENSTYTEDGKPVEKTPHTLAMLGTWGEYEGIKTILFSKFGGHEMESGPFGHVRVEEKHPEPDSLIVTEAAKAATEAAVAVLGWEDNRDSVREEFLKAIKIIQVDKAVTGKAA